MLTKRTDEKTQNRFLAKARNAVYSHCHRYERANGIKLKPSQFMRQFHWPSFGEIAKRMEHEYNIGCVICNEPYLDRDDMTLDIRDPNCLPFWANVGFMCDTKNKQKQRQTLMEFEADREEWRLWKEWKVRREQLKLGDLFHKQHVLI